MRGAWDSLTADWLADAVTGSEVVRLTAVKSVGGKICVYVALFWSAIEGDSEVSVLGRCSAPVNRATLLSDARRLALPDVPLAVGDDAGGFTIAPLPKDTKLDALSGGWVLAAPRPTGKEIDAYARAPKMPRSPDAIPKTPSKSGKWKFKPSGVGVAYEITRVTAASYEDFSTSGWPGNYSEFPPLAAVVLGASSDTPGDAFPGSLAECANLRFGTLETARCVPCLVPGVDITDARETYSAWLKECGRAAPYLPSFLLLSASGATVAACFTRFGLDCLVTRPGH
ncbi:MAG TPA: hypothetical protein VG389_00330 [Myxococcota bacterium]|jgi:hypothetical protein|nr:hypothetical protein [Myxococcota bacterium]